MNEKKFKQLDKIFRKAIRNFRYVTDEDQFGEADKWVCPDPDRLGQIKGDCEDFALYCRKLCRAENITTNLAYCLVEPLPNNAPRGHCVLYIDGMIMDNRFTEIKSVNQLKEFGYEFLAISGNEPGDKWHLVKKTA